MNERDKEEVFSLIWEMRECGIQTEEQLRQKIKERIGTDVLDYLLEKGFLKREAGKVILSPEAEKKARDIIRRQRLAERLLVDVLDINKGSIDSLACEFEHIISPEVERSICILLGHPKLCPHGLPIPEGDCCRKRQDFYHSIVCPLSKLRPSEEGKIAYMLTSAHGQMHKLFSLGLVPNARIKVHQTFPAFVISLDNQQLALDSALAENIYVKKI